MSDEPKPEPPKRRNLEEIIAAVLAGQLDIADLKLVYRVTIDEIDKSGDVPRLARTRVYENGEQVEVTVY